MKQRTHHIHRERRKKEIDYSHYRLALALHASYKKESRKEARLPAHDFRNPVSQKQSGTSRLRQMLARYILAIRKTIASTDLIGKEKRTIVDQQIA